MAGARTTPVEQTGAGGGRGWCGGFETRGGLTSDHVMPSGLHDEGTFPIVGPALVCARTRVAGGQIRNLGVRDEHRPAARARVDSREQLSCRRGEPCPTPLPPEVSLEVEKPDQSATIGSRQEAVT